MTVVSDHRPTDGTAPAGPGLHVHLDVPLPRAVTVGGGTAVFVCGWCYHPRAAIARLNFLVDGAAQPVQAFGMPRLDPFRELHPAVDPYATADMVEDPAAPEDPGLRSYRSGFWGFVRIPPLGADEAELTLELSAELDDGGTAIAPLAQLRALRTERVPVKLERPAASGSAEPLPAPSGSVEPLPAPSGSAEPLIAVCMATHNPPGDLLAAQLDSIRAQTHANWVCVISDDCSSPERFAALQAAVGDDRRFIVSRSPRRLGFYRNFERALSLAPAEAEYLALADQDDRWYSDKLARLLAGIGDARLIYSDARIVARDGALISDTYWSRRRNNHADLLSLMVANCVTGAASLLRHDLLDDALPFPPAQFAHYHDHWIGLCARALGEVRFVSEPLYDYVQHGTASLGHATANRMPTLADRLASLRTRGLGERARKWRMHYFVDIARLQQFAAVLLMRGGGRIGRPERRVLESMLTAEDSTAPLLRFAARGARELTGRPETLGAEWMLFGALLWRRLLSVSVRDRPQRRLRLDAVPPPDLAPGPQRFEAGAEGSAARAIAEKIRPLPFALAADAPPRINLLIPTVDLDHLFAGYIGKFNLAVRLAERGARVRIVTVDPTPPLPRRWGRTLEAYEGLAELTNHVEFAFGRETGAIEVSPQDAFIATTWWTAHIAQRAVTTLGLGRFLYLIQEYEPLTFPMGTYAALARQSYDLPHDALFSTELLRDYFRRHRIGVYAAGPKRGNAASVAFENAITAVSPPTASELAGRSTRRLLFYARPEPHAARNCFELGMLALMRAVDEGAFQDGWELRGIGAVRSGGRLALGAGASLELLPRSAQGDYARLLREHDVGLALMYTPHPSLVPIEMASAGLLTVTNSFENKTPEAMAAISTNLITAEPTVESVAEALRGAARDAGDLDRRAAGAVVNWSRDWATSFDTGVLERVEGFLAG